MTSMYGAPPSVSLSTSARRRPRTSPGQLAILNNFYWNVTAYPSRQQLQQLAQQLGFSHDSVNTWFQNQRQSLRRERRDPRLIQTGHCRSMSSQSQSAPSYNASSSVIPHVITPHAHLAGSGRPISDVNPPGNDDPPPAQDEVLTYHHHSSAPLLPPPHHQQHQQHHQSNPPLFRPIPQHASGAPFISASSSSTAAAGVQAHQLQPQVYSAHHPHQQQLHQGKPIGSPPLPFYFYHHEYPLESVASAVFERSDPNSSYNEHQ